MKSPLKWFGGKSWLVPKLLTMLPEHHTCIEGFAGAAWFTLNKPPATTEIVNDINSTLINFWLVLRNHPDELAKECSLLPDSEQLYWEYTEVAKRLPHEVGKDFELAKVFLYLNAHSYSGLYTGLHAMNFGSCAQDQKAWLRKIENIRGMVWKRIQTVTFYNRSIFDLLRNESCDRDDVFIYLDPPYFDGGAKYEEIPGGIGWGMTDFINLRKLVNSFEHAKILISIDDGEFFCGSGWVMEEVDKNSVLKFGAEPGRECLVYNYKIPTSNPEASTFDPLQF